MEASTLRPTATLPKPRITVGAPLLRLRSDEQLVALFRAGHDEAFQAIHDRYHRRLFAYARQMLPGRQDAEDVLQDVFVRAYAGLRVSTRDLALRPWLFRVAHNRCVDQLRRPNTPPAEVLQLVRSPVHDPVAEVELRESLRRLVEDIRRLPDQQRSALLMRELAGLSYADLATSLGISVGAVKSLLVRARMGLAQASEARETACAVIREQLVEAHDRGLRPNANARKHMRDCSCCKSFRRELRGMSRQLAAVTPAVGPLGFIAKVLGFSGGGGAAGGAGGGAALISGGGTTASAGGLALGTGHVATLIVAAVATAGGTVEIQRTILAPPHHAPKVHVVAPKPREPNATRLQTSPTGAVQAASDEAPARANKYHPAVVEPAVPPGTRVTRPDKADRTIRGAATKRASVAGSSTTATLGASTTGNSVSTGCGTDSPTTSEGAGSTTSTAPSTTSASTTSSSTAGTSSTASSTAAVPACGSTGSSTAASGSSSSSGSTGPSESGTGGTGTTSTGSSTEVAAATGAGSSAPSSNTASG